jgi:hypothetical protein
MSGIKLDLTVYLSFPISGYDYESLAEYVRETKEFLQHCGYKVIHPLACKADTLAGKTNLSNQEDDYQSNLTTNRAIFARDKFSVQKCDIVYVNTFGRINPSLGCTAEIIWAEVFNKFVVYNTEKVFGGERREAPKPHAFVQQAIGVWFEGHEESLQYLKKFINQE